MSFSLMMKRRQSSNILIDILEFGKTCLEHGWDIDIAKLKQHLCDKGYDEVLVDSAIDSFKDNFEILDVNNYRLNSNGYSLLLNHKNLETARQGLRLATLLAVISIFLSVVSIFLSIIFSSQSNETKIDKAQYNQIIKKLENRQNNTYPLPSNNTKQLPTNNKKPD